MNKEIFYDRQFRVWVGRVVDKFDNQVGDCEYFPQKDLAVTWKNSPVTGMYGIGIYTRVYDREVDQRITATGSSLLLKLMRTV